MAKKKNHSQTASLQESLAQIQKLFQDGLLTAEAYESALFALQSKTSSAKSKTTVKGRGAIAQSGGVAAGAGGIAVGGNFQGTLYVGNPPANEQEAMRIYCQYLQRMWRPLPLRGIDEGVSDAAGNRPQLALDQVYIHLDTTNRVPIPKKGPKKKQKAYETEWNKDDTKPPSALEAAVMNPHMVLLGDPGSGKSTFLNHLGLCLAGHRVDPQSGWVSRLSAWPAHLQTCVPIMVVLRDFARSLVPECLQAEPRHLWDFIVSRLEAKKLGFARDPLHQRLENGEAVVLFDGLDEIPTSHQRQIVRDAVGVFLERYSHSRAIITCRILSYQDPSLQIPHVPFFQLGSLDQPKIDCFIEAWYAALAEKGVVTESERPSLVSGLQEAVRKPDLAELSTNPLLLTSMALVHTHKSRLPDARALLYEETLNLLLWRWEDVKTAGDGKETSFRQLLIDAKRTEVDLQRKLWALAFTAHQQGGADSMGNLADIGEYDLVKTLANLHPDGSLDWAQQVVNTMKLRAGVLIEREPGRYAFPHRTFQEYLAGAHLAAQANFPREGARLICDGDIWRQVILLAVGRLVYLSGDYDRPIALAAELCPQHPNDQSKLMWRKVWLAGDVLKEIGVIRVKETASGQDVWHRVQERLVELLKQSALTPRERAEAGNTLANLEDPRFRADYWWLPDETMLGFIEIPGGPFTMGSQEGYEDEQPEHEVTLPLFYMARYPVTVAQFQAFCKEASYQPQEPDSLKGILNHPVVFVTWHDSLAYCHWLTETLRGWEGTPEPLATYLRKGKDGGAPWVITLPSEAEWEKAARGTDGRTYPWENDPDPNKANYDETGIGTTSAVGSFPQGISPYGMEDMSGNVWEWTRSIHGTYPYPAAGHQRDQRENLEFKEARVLRGGAFHLADHYVRCADRFGYYPVGGGRVFGFRVVASPFSSL